MMQDLRPTVGFRTIGIELALYETWSGGIREECDVGSITKRLVFPLP